MCGPGVFQQKTAVRRAERVAELRAMQASSKPRGRGRRNARPRPPGRIDSQQSVPSSSSSTQRPTT
eukprot:4338222-Amphidinium_carterae.1